MTAFKTTHNRKRIKRVVVCINDERVWDQASWSAFIEDVEEMIAKRRADIKKLLRSRRIAQRNLEAFKPYPRHMRERDEAEVIRIAEDNAVRLNELRESRRAAQ